MCVHLGDPNSTDDLAQETMLRAIKALPSFRAESNARTWVLAIARRTCADRVRDRQRTRRLVDRLVQRHEPATDQMVTTVETSELVHSLEPDRREAFVLTQLLGLSYEEAAGVCGCAVGTIRSRVFRARADLVELVTAGEPRLTSADAPKAAPVSSARRSVG